MQIHQETTPGDYAQAMLEHLPVGTALFEANEFRLLAANVRYHSFLPPEWQQGRAIGHLLTEFVPEIEHSDILEIFQRVRDTGASYCLEAYPFAAGSSQMRYWDWT